MSTPSVMSLMHSEPDQSKMPINKAPTYQLGPHKVSSQPTRPSKGTLCQSVICKAVIVCVPVQETWCIFMSNTCNFLHTWNGREWGAETEDESCQF